MSNEFLRLIEAGDADRVREVLSGLSDIERHERLSYNSDVTGWLLTVSQDYMPFYCALKSKNVPMQKALLEYAGEEDLSAMLRFEDFEVFICAQKGKNPEMLEWLLEIAPKKIKQELVIKCLSSRPESVRTEFRALFGYDKAATFDRKLTEVAKKILYEAWVSGGQEAFNFLAALIKCEPRHKRIRDELVAEVQKKIDYQQEVNQAVIVGLGQDMASIMSSMLLQEYGLFQKAPEQTLARREPSALLSVKSWFLR